MTQFYCKYTNMDRAGFSKCKVRLEVLFRGPTECRKILGENRVIK